ncbi:hypothetical protein [Micromonospora sp. CPCC 205561]|uniref:hypothetical protein n=1 Tax=Micromonospora sp. CPCC 205561 TaxID=3122407 RepID=UPI002FF2D4A2
MQRQPDEPSSPLPRDMVWLAALHRAVAEGQQLSSSDAATLRHAEKATSAAALRYAELRADAEARFAEITGNTSQAQFPPAVRDKLALARRAACEAVAVSQQRATMDDPARVSPEKLDVAVTRAVAGGALHDGLLQVLKRRGLRADALDLPTSDVWGWLAQHEGGNEPLPPIDVQRFQQLGDETFIQEALRDAGRQHHDRALAHKALAERWATGAEEILAELERSRDSAAEKLRRTASQELRTRLNRADGAYAQGHARCLEAKLILDGLRARAVELHRGERLRSLRTSCLAETLDLVRLSNPALATAVADACAEHYATCPRARRAGSCADCVPAVADKVRDSLTVTVTGVPEEADTGQQPVEVPSAEDAVCGHSAAAFLCPDLVKQMPADASRVVGVVDVRFHGGRFGFGWVTRYGELGTGIDRAANVHDAWVQAACRAVFDLGEDQSNVRVVCRDERAANVVQYVVRVGLVPDALGFEVDERTRELLAALVRRRGKVFTFTDRCPGPHRGGAAARRLATVVLRAGAETGCGETVRATAEQVSEELGALAGPQDMPAEESGAQWLPGDHDAGELRWNVPLHRAHLNGGWTPFPDGLDTAAQDRQKLRLVFEHPRRGSTNVQVISDVVLRRFGQRWELHGVEWPEGILPGTFVTCRWRPGEARVIARTDLLPSPQRVDGLLFHHHYDAQVVTRENAPGSDQEEPVPELSDTGWVLRTLRKLGHLRADGTAILAEGALLRNCLRLGLPEQRVKGIGAAVRQLVQDRRISRVCGSLDQDDLPWYPPLAGQARVDLLRYAPRVEAVSRRGETRDAHRTAHPGYWVEGYVRRLPAGARASAESIENHREAVRNAEVVDRPLPDGCTFVKRFRRVR